MTAPKKPPSPKNDSKQPTVAKPSGATLYVTPKPNEDDDAATARAALHPSLRAAETWSAFSPNLRRVVGLVPVVDEISKQATAVIAGSMKQPEAMLVAQAHSLDAIFNELARRAAFNMSEHLAATETYLRLALKAQSQCRATLETLSIIKNPPASVAFVKQANIAHGPQQINNGSEPVRARENSNQSNELLEHQRNGTRLEQSAPSLAGAPDSTMAAVVPIHGTEDSGRESEGEPQCHQARRTKS